MGIRKAWHKQQACKDEDEASQRIAIFNVCAILCVIVEAVIADHAPFDHFSLHRYHAARGGRFPRHSSKMQGLATFSLVLVRTSLAEIGLTSLLPSQRNTCITRAFAERCREQPGRMPVRWDGWGWG